MSYQGKRKVTTQEPSAAKRSRRDLRSSTATTTEDTHDDSVYFKELWRLLRSQGWTSKPPPLRRGLDTGYRYIRPGCSASGQEGIDFFVGEQALVEHYKTSQDDAGRIVIDGDNILQLLNPQRIRIVVMLGVVLAGKHARKVLKLSLVARKKF
ncbi:hypothetical protein PF004_g2587 [Phytophthora fragariae]|uniref:Uncharacterized protein n=1 Tax=Phytophthora fragariae TaxID=53985 RepID=A0A6G0PP22_9STRA|nr:hypothetical protein PF004_g2587 [Phytophthora fragariae]